MYGAQGKLLREIAVVEVFYICDKLESWKEIIPCGTELEAGVLVEKQLMDQQFPRANRPTYIIEARVALTVLAEFILTFLAFRECQDLRLEGSERGHDFQRATTFLAHQLSRPPMRNYVG